MNSIAIIGAGQLGSRHLQALAGLDAPASVFVVDPSEEALEVAASRFSEVSKGFKGTVSFLKSIIEIPGPLDVCIVATSSKARKAVIEAILVHTAVKYLVLEKFLFTQMEDYGEVQRLLERHNVKCWVNCPRRMMTVYKELKKELKGNLHFIGTGNNWGLGCNGIHLLDLFAFLTGRNDVALSDELIDEEILQSKRPGYIEFTGTIRGSAGNNSFQITSFPDDASPLQIHIHTPQVRYSIEEGARGKMWISRFENKWAWEEKEFTMPFQSQLTQIVVEDLIKKGSCNLTAYAESAELHKAYLQNLISFLRKKNNDNTINECPVT
jgi:hypothetical protein